MSYLAPLLQKYFTDHAMTHRGFSPHTIAAYRDSWRLLITYIGETRQTDIAAIDIDTINADLVTEFLTHLSADRHNSVSTRNARLTAIRAVLGYGLPYHPEHAETIRQVLSIEPHRHQRPIVSYLSTEETTALLASPNTATWTGRRDLMLLSLTIHTGLRASELLSLTINSVHTGAGPHITCQGKGRKNRATPLTPNTRNQLQAYLTERRRRPGDTLFPGPRGNQLSRDALERRLSLHVSTATGQCPSIARKIITMHTLRHTCAMNLLHAGIDLSVIALWLGHAQTSSTEAYLHADMTLKEQALERTRPQAVTPGRYRPSPDILEWLTQL